MNRKPSRKKPSLLSPPAHGAIETREIPVIVGLQQRGRLGARNCRGVKNLGIGVYYQPHADFQGTDRVIYRVSFPSYIYFDDTFDIVVFR